MVLAHTLHPQAANHEPHGLPCPLPHTWDPHGPRHISFPAPVPAAHFACLSVACSVLSRSYALPKPPARFPPYVVHPTPTHSWMRTCPPANTSCQLTCPGLSWIYMSLGPTSSKSRLLTTVTSNPPSRASTTPLASTLHSTPPPKHTQKLLFQILHTCPGLSWIFMSLCPASSKSRLLMMVR